MSRLIYLCGISHKVSNKEAIYISIKLDELKHPSFFQIRYIVFFHLH